MRSSPRVAIRTPRRTATMRVSSSASARISSAHCARRADFRTDAKRRCVTSRLGRRRATVRAKRDDEEKATSVSFPEDPNERLREELRRALAETGETLDGRSRTNDVSAADDVVNASARNQDGDASKQYRITVRDFEIFRYTTPDFFPDFDETPIQSRRNLGLDTAASATRSHSGRQSGNNANAPEPRAYVWRRGVLAGTERSDPLDVIERDRLRFEETLRTDGNPPADEEKVHRDRFRSSIGSNSNRSRRRIPPPPRRDGNETPETETLGFVAKTFLVWTFFLYLAAFFLAASREVMFRDAAFLGPAPDETETVAPPRAAPESIANARAGEIWEDRLHRERAK